MAHVDSPAFLFSLTFLLVDCSNFSQQRAGLEFALLLIPTLSLLSLFACSCLLLLSVICMLLVLVPHK